MAHLCTEERFLNDVNDHTMTIIRDERHYRHIRFRRGASYIYGFDLITWPGYLCIVGDCGTYVFQRLNDMFEFFRMDDNDFNKAAAGHLSINPDYWGEKLQSIDTNTGYREFDEDRFRERVTDHFTDYWKDNDYPDAKAQCWTEIEEYVLSRTDEGENFAYSAVHEFSFRYNDFEKPPYSRTLYFQDFFDGGGTDRFTFHYIWCLYAIVWGIKVYDEAKK